MAREGRCADCGNDYARLQRHHVIPKHKGGKNHHTNYVFICPNCHDERHADERSERIQKRWTPEERAEQGIRSKRWWATASSAEIEARNKQISEQMLGNKRAVGNPGRIRQGWGNGFSECQGCGTSERPHKSRGLCDACYLRAYRAELPEDVRRLQVHGRTSPPAPRSVSDETKRKTSESLKLAYAEGRRKRGHSQATRDKIRATKRGLE